MPGLDAYRRGKKTDLAGLGCVWLDLDIGTAGHASKTLPPDEDAALEILRALPREPSMVVASGGGYHLYWLLDGYHDAARVEALCKAWQTVAVAAAAARGWHVDRKHDSTTVLRVPGTTNRKPGVDPRPVALECPDDPPRYAIADLEAAVAQRPPSAVDRPTSEVAAPAAAPSPVPVDLGALREALAKARRSKARGSDERKAQADLLGRVLDGEALAEPGELHHARVRLAGLLAYWLPASTPWAAALELLRPTLAATKLAPGTTVEATIEKTRKLYEDSMRSRLAADARRAKEDAAFAELARRIRGGDALAESEVDPPQPQPLRSGSFLSLVEVLRGGGGLDDESLEHDSMAGRVTVGRRPLSDTDVNRIRLRIQQTVVVERDRKGEPVGLTFSKDEVRAAAELVAEESPFHPVQEYLRELAWDGQARIARVVTEVLGAEPTPLNERLLRRWMISAVARAMGPGCKADAALILVGKTGTGKSSFFRILGSPWSLDTQFADVTSPKALMTLRRAWIYEWAELEVMRRAEDINQVKAWISSPTDEYVPQYGRAPVEVPRSFVIAGTTESDEFLVDERGNRRFWPITVGASIDLKLLAEWRDALWAEAVAAHAAGERWWLEGSEGDDLRAAQTEHESNDAWSEPVITWAENPIDPGSMIGAGGKGRSLAKITTANILRYALGIEPGRWRRADEMRVGAIMRRAGWRKIRPDPFKPHVWIKPTSRGALSIVE